MASTRSTLELVEQNLSESMGERTGVADVRLSPVAQLRDVGRRPLQEYGSIQTDQILPDPDQPRTEFSEEAIERLANSLRDAGQLAPIRVRWSEPAGKWLIVAGERRWRAAKLAGLPAIDCFCHERELSEGEVLQAQMIENLLRENLKPLEEARGFERMMQIHGYTGKQVARALSVPESKVTRSLALLRLPEEIQTLVESEQIAPRTAYEISRIEDPDQQQRLAQQAAAKRLTHQDIAQKVQQQRRSRTRKTKTHKLSFAASHSWHVVVRGTGSNYHEVEQALLLALEEVRHRIDGGVQLY
ncbi:MAG: ParB/RepB/Spo0J family partition protein [Pirellulales bacterium]|nr:ParB/RepB/Spo0J family partition protein [Pirellulales bacterium]